MTQKSNNITLNQCGKFSPILKDNKKIKIVIRGQKAHDPVIQGGRGRWNPILKSHNVIIHGGSLIPIKFPRMPTVRDF